MKKNKKGFSLIELILVLSIIMGLMVGIFYIYKNVKISLAAQSVSQQLITLKTQYDSISGSAGASAKEKIDNYLINSDCMMFATDENGSLNVTSYNKKCFKDVGIDMDDSTSNNDGAFVGFGRGTGVTPAIFGISDPQMCMKVAINLASLLPSRTNDGDYSTVVMVVTDGTELGYRKGVSLKDLAEICSYFKNSSPSFFINIQDYT